VLIRFFACLLLFGWVGITIADELTAEFRVKNAETRVVDEVYRLDANIDFRLASVMKEALLSGVDLVIELQIKVVNERDWMWNANIAELSLRYQLRYHALSERYLVIDVSTGLQQNFRQLDDALQFIGNIRDFPMLDQRLLSVGDFYIAQLRAVLDKESLPTPMKLQAYTLSRWNLLSEWYSWPLQP